MRLGQGTTTDIKNKWAKAIAHIECVKLNTIKRIRPSENVTVAAHTGEDGGPAARGCAGREVTLPGADKEQVRVEGGLATALKADS